MKHGTLQYFRYPTKALFKVLAPMWCNLEVAQCVLLFLASETSEWILLRDSLEKGRLEKKQARVSEQSKSREGSVARSEHHL